MSNPIVQVPADVHPWSTVFALAKATEDPTSWRLAGGLMVHLHAMLHGVKSRPTTDTDFLVDVLTHKYAVREVRGVLQRLGFQLQDGSLSDYTTRMRQGNYEVDLLVDNHLSKYLRSRAMLNGRSMLGMPGSRKAVQRSMFVDLEYAGETATICVPDLIGALLAKAAAWRETGQYGKDRHMIDAALLASLIDDPEAELARLNNRSKSDRKNVRTLRRALLGSDGDEYFDYLDSARIAKAGL